MKSVELIKKSYKEAESKTLYTKDVGNGMRLDIRVKPLAHPQLEDYPCHIDLAFDSVVWRETSRRNSSITSQVIKDYLILGTLEDLEHMAMEAIRYDMIQHITGLKTGKRAAYICPVQSSGQYGYKNGYVIGWDAEDVYDVAEYLAGGRVELVCWLVDPTNVKVIDTAWLGELSYADVAGETDTYRRIIEGENLTRALEDLAGIEPPTPANQKYPGAESLATFTKLT